MYILYSSIKVANCSGVSCCGTAGTGVGAIVAVGVTGATVDAVDPDTTGATVAEGFGGGSMIIHGSALGAACMYPVRSVKE